VNEISVRFDPTNRVIGLCPGIIGQPGGDKALNVREPEFRAEHCETHSLKLLQAALEILSPSPCSAALERSPSQMKIPGAHDKARASDADVSCVPHP
jgi:hypothetical protein